MTQTWSPETSRIQSQDLENTSEARTARSASARESDGEIARQRHQRIAEAAYRLAAQRNFTPGRELEDWLAAEREVDAESVKDDSLFAYEQVRSRLG